jgi:AraC family transcriptional regulator
MSRKSETLYTSPLVTVRDVVCSEGCGSGRHEEQCQAASIAFVRSGTFVRRDRMGRHVADATRVVFFDPAEPYMVDHPVPGGDRSTVLLFDESTLREAVRDARGDRVFARATRAGDADIHLVHRRLLAGAHRRAEGVCEDGVEVEETALRLLQLTTGGADTPLHGAAARRAATLAADAQVLIAGSFTGCITLEGLAKTLGVSPFALCRAFRRATGSTVHQHLTGLRLATALEQLPRYHERLTDLALDLGFSSHSHFTQAFRSYFGRAPSTVLRSA